MSGLPTNLGFLRRCAKHPDFVAGGVTTAFLDDYGEAILAEEAAAAPPLAVALGALAHTLQQQQKGYAASAKEGGGSISGGGQPDPFTQNGAVAGGWRLFGAPTSTVGNGHIPINRLWIETSTYEVFATRRM